MMGPVQMIGPRSFRLQAEGTRWRNRVFAAIFAVLVAATAIGVTWTLRQTFLVYKLRRGVGDTWFLAADGRRWFRLDEHRRDVPLADIPRHLRNAFVAVEDHRFYTHLGVDPLALGRAVVRNLTSDTMEGGSTLTQQLARTLFLSNQRTYGRKIREGILALNIDAQLTKDQILELYLNRIYLSGGVYGVETMSRLMFAKPAKHLTLAEAALVAGLARAPSALSPWTNLDGAIERSHVVLRRMREEGFITPEQERAARASRISVRPYPGATDPRGGYAKEHLRQQFRDQFGGDHPPDWVVRTTFVPELQDAAERAVSEGLRRFGNSQLQAALVALDPETGDILALVGGRDFRQSQFNRATRSRRQPGSAFKPFLYAAALEHGYSPLTVLSGLASIAPQGPEEWAPRNASGAIPDELTIRAALLESNNRAASALQQRMGSRHLLRLASDVGMRELPDVPSLSLGTGLVTPVELTAAFAAFPNGGYAVASAQHRSSGQCRRSDCHADDRATRPRDLGPISFSDGGDARRCHGPGHGLGGEAVGRPISGGREDGNDEQFQGCVVCRLFLVARRWRVGRVRPASDNRQRRVRIALRPADLVGLHASNDAQPSTGVIRHPRGSPGRAVVRDLVSASGGRLPHLYRIPEGRR